MFQQTIQSKAAVSGRGLHTGAHVNFVMHPAPAKHGIKFKRVDLEGAPVVPADCDLVTTVERGTTVQKGEASISTVEHAMAAFRALGVDNLLIEVDGPEVPIMDGSSMPFIEAIESVGVEEQEAEREVFQLKETIHYKDDEKDVEFIAMPSDRFQITALVDYNSSILSQQHAVMKDLREFKREFSKARTFCFLTELEMLLKAGLIKGGDVDNAVVLVDKVLEEEELKRLGELFGRDDIKVEKEGTLNNVELRYDNEPARHKLLDVVGDLSLAGTAINAHIMVRKPGHKSNVEFAKLLKKHIKEQRKKVAVPHYDPTKEPIKNTQQIEAMLPHRYPFLLVDKVIELSDKHVVGIKNVTMNEPQFQGHFPNNPVMPGVFQIEGLAQTGGILALSTVEEPSKWDTYFLKIDNAKFKHMVVPGDTLIYKMELNRPIRRGIVDMHATAFVGDKLVCEADLMATIVKAR